MITEHVLLPVIPAREDNFEAPLSKREPSFFQCQGAAGLARRMPQLGISATQLATTTTRIRQRHRANTLSEKRVLVAGHSIVIGVPSGNSVARVVMSALVMRMQP